MQYPLSSETGSTGRVRLSNVQRRPKQESEGPFYGRDTILPSQLDCYIWTSLLIRSWVRQDTTAVDLRSFDFLLGMKIRLSSHPSKSER